MPRTPDSEGFEPKPSFSNRLRDAFLKPAKPGALPADVDPLTLDEIEHAAKYANDKERLIGLLGAPWAGGIGILITSSLIANDPPALLQNGELNRLHVSVALYHEVMAVLLVLAVLMLVFAWFRKRLFLGIVMALYGITIFNLRFWGFGVPYLMAGAWYLVRSYRMQRSLREARGDAPWRAGSSGGTSSVGRRPRTSKRYTPPLRRSHP